jgi:sugar lactone lactonase YvrE
VRRFCLLLIMVVHANAQLSPSAYRVLGQPDLQQQGINTVQATSLNGPGGVALDSRGGKVRLYIADTGNSRVLAWPDVHSYGIGDSPALVLGQPGPAYSNPQGIGSQGFNTPLGPAVDPTTGDLYVADSANSRVLRFRNPFANSKVQPDAVYGQPDFNTLTANSTGVSASSMSKPRAVACDAAGNLWVADTGNNRVLHFGANSLNSTPPPPADTVIGQKDFASYAPDAGSAVSASGLDAPSGLAFDAQGNLYVADTNNQRVLKFSAPLGPGNQNPAATAVFGAANFTTRGVLNPVSNSSLALPAGMDVDSSGKVYVASPAFNRVLIFPPAGGGATAVLGQADFVTTKANA